jgi:hypothetical protein
MEILHTLVGMTGFVVAGIILIMSVIYAPGILIGLVLTLISPIVQLWYVGEPFWKER